MKKTNLSDFNPASVPDGSPFRIAILAAEWNPEVTDAMLHAATHTLLSQGVGQDNIPIFRVPGTFELPSAAAHLLLSDPTLNAVICIGCVIQGETRHFEFICQAVSQGLTNVSLQFDKPVIFSVLTCDTPQQALDRAGGTHGNKGTEGAIAALKMCHLWHTSSPKTSV